MVAGPTKHVCYACKRKFSGEDVLLRHEKMSDLHRHNLERQDELMMQRKDELRMASAMLRQQIIAVENDLADQALPNAMLQNHRTVLDMQMRQLLQEYSQAQEMLENNRHMKAPGKAARSRPAAAKDVVLGNTKFSAGASTWQSNKDVQEDRYMLDIRLQSSTGQEIVGYCVLDGHSGSMCVDMLVERLTPNLQKCLSARSTLSEEVLAQVIVEAFHQTDEEFNVRARQYEVLDGSTLLLALMYAEGSRHRLFIANVGDSRAVLCRSGGVGPDGEPRLQAVRLSDDHKPGRPDEKERVESRGGVVDLQGVWRVFTPGPANFGGRTIARWGLAVSRAFGDLLLKEPERYGCHGVTPGGLVIATPEIRVIDLDVDEDRFLLLACDGIWDVLSDDDCVAFCAQQHTAEKAALELNKRAFSAGSDDNLTVLVVSWSPNDAA